MDLRQAFALLILSPATALAWSDGPTTYPDILSTERAELTHSLDQLRRQDIPPYYLSYQIIETRAASVSGSFGALTSSNESRDRLLLIDLRVGDYALDNTRQVRGNPLNPVPRNTAV